MGQVSVLPDNFDLTSSSNDIITVVLPAVNCNLNCSWCYIRGRKEVHDEPMLSVQDYVNFIEEAATESTIKLSLIAIQGYEPLLEESWPYVVAIMKIASKHNISVSMVTNGTNLKEKARLLADFPALDCIHVSLDSSEAENHDATRGVQGTFNQVIEGIEEAKKYTSLRDKLVIASVLQPGQESQLNRMPNLLKDKGIKKWVINPLVNVGDKNFGDLIASDRLPFSLRRLNQLALELDIELVVDDELGNCNNMNLSSELNIRTLKNPNQLIRLAPHGQLSVGGESIRFNKVDFTWDKKQNQTAKDIVNRVYNT